jgi:hypothetical protein
VVERNAIAAPKGVLAPTCPRRCLGSRGAMSTLAPKTVDRTSRADRRQRCGGLQGTDFQGLVTPNFALAAVFWAFVGNGLVGIVRDSGWALLLCRNQD